MPPGKYLAGGLQPGCTADSTSAQYKFYGSTKVFESGADNLNKQLR